MTILFNFSLSLEKQKPKRYGKQQQKTVKPVRVVLCLRPQPRGVQGRRTGHSRHPQCTVGGLHRKEPQRQRQVKDIQGYVHVYRGGKATTGYLGLS